MEMKDLLQQAAAEQFDKCVSFTAALAYDPEVADFSMKHNIELARGYYQKAGGKNNVSIVSLNGLNRLESKFDMEITQ